MRSNSIKPAMAFLLIFSLLHLQIGSAQANKKQIGTVRTVFLGIQFDNLPEDIQDILTWRISEILASQKSFALTKPDVIAKNYGHEKLVALLEKQDSISFSAFAKQFEFDHVFSGTLANRSPDNNRIHLIGELKRFDAKTSKLFSFEIDCDYNEFGNAILNFKEQYVSVSFKSDNSRLTIWKVLLAGAIVAGIIILSSAAGSGGGEGEDNEPSPVDE